MTRYSKAFHACQSEFDPQNLCKGEWGEMTPCRCHLSSRSIVRQACPQLTHTLDVHMQNIFLNNEVVQSSCVDFFKRLNFQRKS